MLQMPSVMSELLASGRGPGCSQKGSLSQSAACHFLEVEAWLTLCSVHKGQEICFCSYSSPGLLILTAYLCLLNHAC